MEASPDDSIMKMKEPEEQEQSQLQDWELDQRKPGAKQSGVLNVIVSGLALFSDGYNAEISTYHYWVRVGIGRLD